MRIALDGLGGDFGPAPVVEACCQALKDLDCELQLVGPEERLLPLLEKRGLLRHPRLKLVPASQEIQMAEEPARACREKPDSSLLVAARQLAQKKADAMISAGNSGAAMVASLWSLKRIPGVLRPAIAVPFPTLRGASILLDAGANSDCKPWHLLQFAQMGIQYCRTVLKIENPSVGILSIGEEESKGNELVRETLPLLKTSLLHFRGPVEGSDLPRGSTDVVVCDGFVGNVALKLCEGVASSIFDTLRREIAQSVRAKWGALLLKNVFRKLKKRLSYEEYGGAPLLGVRGTVIICHGKSNAVALFHAIRVAQEIAGAKMEQQIEAALSRTDHLLPSGRNSSLGAP
ncbi:MAG: phosphate acyltransferase PlsX [Elusimicrobia bacterium]|nr:phosphate acyltransferase PlsX [Elusimicrobiota bacterium]